jgi:hypothetical protein
MADGTYFEVQGRYLLKRPEADIEEITVTWGVKVVSDCDITWTYSAYAWIDDENEWEEFSPGPWSTEEEAIDDARHRLAGNDGLVYGPGGDVLHT